MLLPGLGNAESSCFRGELSPIKDLPDLTKVDLAPKRNSVRESEILSWWREHCPDLSQQNVKRFRQDNLVCRVEGASDKTLVIGAHYDKVSAGYGVADNWSGVVLIDALMRHYKQLNHDISLEFVAFAGEEDGLFGSKAYVQDMKYPVIGMLNLDTIGLTDLIIDEASDPDLSCQLQAIAATLNIPISTQRWRAVSSDWERFQAAGIPAIGIHSVNKRTVRNIHHKRDKAGNVDMAHMDNAYRLARHFIDQFTR